MGASETVVVQQPRSGHGAADDSALVVAVQGGDIGAYEELFRRHHGAVVRVCARRLRDQVEADEVAQAAFVRALERIDQCGGERRFSAWIQVIAQRLCLDLLRARVRTVPDDDPVRDDRQALNVVIDLDAGTVTEEALVRRERSAKLHEALALLPDRQRQVVVARHLEGRRPPEIAASLGLTVGAVDSLLLRGRRRLAQSCEQVLADDAARPLPPATTTTAAGASRPLRPAAAGEGAAITVTGPVLQAAEVPAVWPVTTSAAAPAGPHGPAPAPP